VKTNLTVSYLLKATVVWIQLPFIIISELKAGIVLFYLPTEDCTYLLLQNLVYGTVCLLVCVISPATDNLDDI